MLGVGTQTSKTCGFTTAKLKLVPRNEKRSSCSGNQPARLKLAHYLLLVHMTQYCAYDRRDSLFFSSTGAPNEAHGDA